MQLGSIVWSFEQAVSWLFTRQTQKTATRFGMGYQRIYCDRLAFHGPMTRGTFRDRLERPDVCSGPALSFSSP